MSSPKLRRPENYWSVRDDYEEQYRTAIGIGAEVASRSSLNVVAICRNAMPFLPNTLLLVDEFLPLFRDVSVFIYENDSDDGTTEALRSYSSARDWVHTQHERLNREDFRGHQPMRTVRLAEYRNKCRDWVEANRANAAFTVVLDMDPHGGFSVDGVLNSIGQICIKRSGGNWSPIPGAMASYSLYARIGESGEPEYAQYDAWAARLNWWTDDRMHAWFHLLMPPVGSPPIQMNSAFGGLCVYDTKAFLSSRYDAGPNGDCEHVLFHKGMKRAGYGLWLNPGSRYIAILPS